MNEELLTDKEFAEYMKVSASTVRTWKNRGIIPNAIIFKLPGTAKGTTRYIKSKVSDWINGCLQA